MATQTELGLVSGGKVTIQEIGPDSISCQGGGKNQKHSLCCRLGYITIWV